LPQLEQSAHSQQQRSQVEKKKKKYFFIEKLENKDKRKIKTKKPSMI